MSPIIIVDRSAVKCIIWWKFKGSCSLTRCQNGYLRKRTQAFILSLSRASQYLAQSGGLTVETIGCVTTVIRPRRHAGMDESLLALSRAQLRVTRDIFSLCGIHTFVSSHLSRHSLFAASSSSDRFFHLAVSPPGHSPAAPFLLSLASIATH